MATISEKKAIIELYVGWFNRVPDVAGINFWIEQFDAGSSLQQISGEFYQAAIHQFSAETGYSEGMTDDAFIAQLYDGVMGRGPTTALAPNPAEIGYWTNALAALNNDKGALLVQMIIEIKAFDSTGNADIKAVQDKFANKVQVAETLSISGTPLWKGTTIEQGKVALTTVTNDDASVASAISTALLATTEGFVLTVGAATVDEGATATFTIATNAVEDGTVVAYTIEGGIDSNDIVGGSLQGNVTIIGGTATISVPLVADRTTEELETLTVSLDGKLVEASTIVADTSANDTYALAADATTVNEGDTATFTITSNAVDGTVVAYTIGDGINAADVVGGGTGSLQGNVTIVGGTATISVPLVADLTTEGLETLTVSLDGKLVEASTIITDSSTAPFQTVTTAADTFVGTANKDTFIATKDTLGLGDSFDGKGSTDDTLDISISGLGTHLTGFATKDVEVIKVKSLAITASTLDMSDVKGATELKSYETDGASLTFNDIQDTTAQISIMDTDENHTINYDAQTLSGDADTITLNISEIRQPAVAADGVVIDFTQNTTKVDADIEKLVINSNLNAGAPSATNNDIKTLSVGSDLTSLEIKGNDVTGHSDLIVRDALDKMLDTVDAKTLDATLTLDMSAADASVSTITFDGSKKDTSITFGTAANTKTITTQGGNDIIIAGNGANTVVSAAGDDTITTGTGDDTINAGAGDDTLVDAGGNNGTAAAPVDMGAGNDIAIFNGTGNDVVDMGTGDDILVVAAGSDSVKLGEGNDILIMTPDDLDVSDTVDGGEGHDIIQITDTDRITLSETQHVTKIEEFELYGGGSTLALNDSLIASVDADANGDKTFTVNTKDTEFDGGAISVLSSDVNSQPVDDFGRTDRDGAISDYIIDMTKVTTPDYKFTLDGSGLGEILITNDSGINNASELNFAGGTDTLVIVDGATVEATDSGKMIGLERIFLESSNNVAQVWEIDATGFAAGIFIEVSPTVPAGSVLKVIGTANVKGNANISVSGAGVTLVQDTEFEFTANADLLNGTDADDIFTAESVDRIQAGDVAKGNLGNDTLLLNFGVFNAGNSLHQQLNEAGITEIETLTFKRDLSTAVSFDDIDGTTGNMENALSTINLTDRDDNVIVDDANGVTVNGLGGADILSTNSSATLNGGDGNDLLSGSIFDDTLNGNAGDDLIVGFGGNDFVDGGTGNDDITTDIGDDFVIGGEGNDVVDVLSGDDYVDLGAGNDQVTIAANDLSSSDFVDGGTGTDTLITSDTNMTDADFTNVTTMEELTFNAATLGNFGAEFEESGIITINGSADIDSINFQNISNNTHLIIKGNEGADIIKGGSGNDSITGGEDADIITGSTGADAISLIEAISVRDQVVYDRAEDGAQTGSHIGFDTVTGFEAAYIDPTTLTTTRTVINNPITGTLIANTDTITIDGSLEAALDIDAVGGDFNSAAATFVNNAALNANIAGLAVYTNTSLRDNDLEQENFTEVLNLLNTNLQTSVAGDNVLYVVQSTNNTGIYFYQENAGGSGTGNDVIDLSELKMLSLVKNSLLSEYDIADNDVAIAGVAGANVVVPGTVPVTIGTGATSANVIGNNADNEIFGFDVAAALATSVNTQVTLSEFDVINDILQLDLVSVNAGLISLNQLDGIEGITVQVSGINNETLINFGGDADGDIVTISLSGIIDASTVAIEVI